MMETAAILKNLLGGTWFYRPLASKRVIQMIGVLCSLLFTEVSALAESGSQVAPDVSADADFASVARQDPSKARSIFVSKLKNIEHGWHFCINAGDLFKELGQYKNAEMAYKSALTELDKPLRQDSKAKIGRADALASNTVGKRLGALYMLFALQAESEHKSFGRIDSYYALALDSDRENDLLWKNYLEFLKKHGREDLAYSAKKRWTRKEVLPVISDDAVQK